MPATSRNNQSFKHLQITHILIDSSLAGQLPRLPATSTPPESPRALGRRSLVTAGRDVRRWCQVLPGPHLPSTNIRQHSVFHNHLIHNTIRETAGSFSHPPFHSMTNHSNTYRKRTITSSPPNLIPVQPHHDREPLLVSFYANNSSPILYDIIRTYF